MLTLDKSDAFYWNGIKAESFFLSFFLRGQQRDNAVSCSCVLQEGSEPGPIPPDLLSFPLSALALLTSPAQASVHIPPVLVLLQLVPRHSWPLTLLPLLPHRSNNMHMTVSYSLFKADLHHFKDPPLSVL